MEKVLFDWSYKIVKTGESDWLTFAILYCEWEEINLRFKLKNLDKVIEYIRDRFWNRSRSRNPVTWVPEERPLKLWLKSPNCKLFYR